MLSMQIYDDDDDQRIKRYAKFVKAYLPHKLYGIGQWFALKYYVSTLWSVGVWPEILLMIMWLEGVERGLEVNCLCKRYEFLSTFKRLLSFISLNPCKRSLIIRIYKLIQI